MRKQTTFVAIGALRVNYTFLIIFFCSISITDNQPRTHSNGLCLNKMWIGKTTHLYIQWRLIMYSVLLINGVNYYLTLHSFVLWHAIIGNHRNTKRLPWHQVYSENSKILIMIYWMKYSLFLNKFRAYWIPIRGPFLKTVYEIYILVHKR